MRVTLLFSWFLILLVAGCGGQKSEEEPKSSASKTETNSLDETSMLPEGILRERLAYVSQLDNLNDTIHDFRRCSAAATLNAYLLLGGDFEKVAKKFDVATELTYENVHRLQEALYLHADKDDEPGIYGASIPRYDEAGNLQSWDWHPDDEYQAVLEALGLTADRIYGPTKATVDSKRSAIMAALERDNRVVFIVGVDEDMETESFGPMDETGNHYVAIFETEGKYYALDSYRTPGRRALVELTKQQVEDNLLETPNAIVAVSLHATDQN